MLHPRPPQKQKAYHWRIFTPANNQSIWPLQWWIIAPAFSKALDAIKKDVEAAIPGVTIQATNPKDTDSLRLTVRAGGSQIKIELSPVLRGTVWPVESRGVVEQVEDIRDWTLVLLPP